jgi:hypothetical protein
MQRIQNEGAHFPTMATKSGCPLFEKGAKVRIVTSARCPKYYVAHFLEQGPKCEGLHVSCVCVCVCVCV